MENRIDCRLQKFKEALCEFSDTNGGIKFEHASAFRGFMDTRTKPDHIKEAASMLQKSKLKVILSFFDNNGWDLINKWLTKMSQARKVSDKEIAPGIQKLVFQILGKWLSKSSNVLPEPTVGIIDLYSSDNKKTQKIIQKFRSKWQIGSHTSPDCKKDVQRQSPAPAAPIQAIDDQLIARKLRKKNTERQSEVHQENENPSPLPKESRKVKKSIADTPNHDSAPESVTSHSKDENLATKQEDEANPRRLRKKNIQRQSEVHQENGNPSPLPKKSRKAKKRVAGTPNRDSAPESVTSHSEVDENLATKQEDKASNPRSLKKKSIQRQSEVHEENENTSPLPKKSRTVKKSASGIPTRDCVQETVTSHQSEGRDLVTKQENEASSSRELAQLSPSRYDSTVTDPSHRFNEPFDMGNGNDSYIYHRRVDMMERNNNGHYLNMEQTNFLNMPLTINMPGTIQYHFYA